jgi:outer membrane protein assembly factor BamD (BamD/ComL family)
MIPRLGFLLAFLMGLTVMVGYSSPAPSRPSEDQSNQAIKAPPYRNQQYTLKTEQMIREFLQQHPDSDFAPIVRQLLKDVEENLALGDFKVAQFYASRGNYAGALSRMKEIIDNYPSFSRIDEVNKLYAALSAKQPSLRLEKK